MNATGAPVAPWFITQLNVEAAFGINPRRFRELVRELGLPIIELGKLRGVEARRLARRVARARQEGGRARVEPRASATTRGADLKPPKAQPRQDRKRKLTATDRNFVNALREFLGLAPLYAALRNSQERKRTHV